MKQIGRYEEESKAKKNQLVQSEQEIERLKENSKNLILRIE